MKYIYSTIISDKTKRNKTRMLPKAAAPATVTIRSSRSCGNSNSSSEWWPSHFLSKPDRPLSTTRAPSNYPWPGAQELEEGLVGWWERRGKIAEERVDARALKPQRGAEGRTSYNGPPPKKRLFTNPSTPPRALHSFL